VFLLIKPSMDIGSFSLGEWTSLHTTIALMMAVSGPVVAATFWAVTRPDLARKT